MQLQIRPDLPDFAGRCSWPPALRFIRPLDQRDGRLRTVDEQRTREHEHHQGGDDDGKERGDPSESSDDRLLRSTSGGWKRASR